MIPFRSVLVVIAGIIAAVALFRACSVPHPAQSDTGGRAYIPCADQGGARCNRWRGDDWMPCALATRTTEALLTPAPTPRDSATWEPQPRAWRWDEVAVIHAADKPTMAPTPTRSATPTQTRPPRATRTARPTGTPTQSGMLPPPTCGAGTVRPGEGTAWPACYPHGPSFTPTPDASDTPTPSDTPPASATTEPTPTAIPRAVPVPGGWVPAPEQHLYRFPVLLNRRGVRP